MYLNKKIKKSHSFVEISGMQSKRHPTEKANKLSKNSNNQGNRTDMSRSIDQLQSFSLFQNKKKENRLSEQFKARFTKNEKNA